MNYTQARMRSKNPGNAEREMKTNVKCTSIILWEVADWLSPQKQVWGAGLEENRIVRHLQIQEIWWQIRVHNVKIVFEAPFRRRYRARASMFYMLVRIRIHNGLSVFQSSGSIVEGVLQRGRILNLFPSHVTVSVTTPFINLRKREIVCLLVEWGRLRLRHLTWERMLIEYPLQFRKRVAQWRHLFL